MAGTLTLSQIAEKTGMSLRFWQAKAKAGAIPNLKRLRSPSGKGCKYFVQADGFDAWWAGQLEDVKPCQESIICISGANGGGLRSATKAKRFESHSKRDLLDKLKNVATAS
jgi:hypothetical protein